ncbi:a disintegrin and metalloproteinase with thrombospondin motifs adt-1, partial [Caerostris extrusa]
KVLMLQMATLIYIWITFVHGNRPKIAYQFGVALGSRSHVVRGLAWVNGMCRPKHSCTLERVPVLKLLFVIAHEMGHSLGMMHDGGNDCDTSAYLMSEKTGPGRITWSTCSNDYLDKILSVSRNEVDA